MSHQQIFINQNEDLSSRENDTLSYEEFLENPKIAQITKISHKTNFSLFQSIITDLDISILDKTDTMMNSQVSECLESSNPKITSDRSLRRNMASNMVRDFKKSIQKQLKNNKEAYKKILRLIEIKQIRRQQYGVDGVFLILLFARDKESIINKIEFERIIKNFSDKFAKQNENALQNYRKNISTVYMAHFENFQKISFGPQSQQFIKNNSRDLLSKVIQKKKYYQQHYLEKLLSLHLSLQQIHIDQNKSCHLTVSTPIKQSSRNNSNSKKTTKS